MFCVCRDATQALQMKDRRDEASNNLSVVSADSWRTGGIAGCRTLAKRRRAAQDDERENKARRNGQNLESHAPAAGRCR